MYFWTYCSRRSARRLCWPHRSYEKLDRLNLPPRPAIPDSFPINHQHRRLLKGRRPSQDRPGRSPPNVPSSPPLEMSTPFSWMNGSRRMWSVFFDLGGAHISCRTMRTKIRSFSSIGWLWVIGWVMICRNCQIQPRCGTELGGGVRWSRASEVSV